MFYLNQLRLSILAQGGYWLGFVVLWSLALFWYLSVEAIEPLLWFAQHRTSWLNQLFLILTALGEAWGFVAAALFFYWRGQYRSLKILLALILALLLANLSLKAWFAQPRPWIYFSEVLGELERLNWIEGLEPAASWTSSFPSGHTSSAFALYGFLAWHCRHLGSKLGFLVLAWGVGWSRVYLAQHFLADVLAGAMLGSFLAWLAYLFLEPVAKPRIFVK